MLIAMAGLPATGKSTLGLQLARALDATVLSKDAVRATLFPPPLLDFSAAQDDLCMDAIYRAAALIYRTRPGQTIILDGRTFLRAYQLRALLEWAATVGQQTIVIECVCAPEIAQQRLEGQQAAGDHPAGNRTLALYEELKAAAEPLTVPRLILDTGELPLVECVARALAYLDQRRSACL